MALHLFTSLGIHTLRWSPFKMTLHWPWHCFGQWNISRCDVNRGFNSTDIADIVFAVPLWNPKTAIMASLLEGRKLQETETSSPSWAPLTPEQPDPSQTAKLQRSSKPTDQNCQADHKIRRILRACCFKLLVSEDVRGGVNQYTEYLAHCVALKWVKN